MTIFTEENFRRLSDHIKKYGRVEDGELNQFPTLMMNDWKIKYIKHDEEEVLSFFREISLVGGLILKDNQLETFSLIKFQKENEVAQKRIATAFEEVVSSLNSQ